MMTRLAALVIVVLLIPVTSCVSEETLELHPALEDRIEAAEARRSADLEEADGATSNAPAEDGR